MLSIFLPAGALIVSFLALGISVVTIFVNRNQKKIDNLVSLQQFLHTGELSEARRCIREGEISIDLKDQRIRQVCSSFEFAGLLVRHGMVNKTIFLEYWRAPLIGLSDAFSELAHQKTGKLTIREHYRCFWWLMNEAKKPQQA